MGSQWRLFWALMGYGLLVSVLVPALAWLFVGMVSPVSFLIASALIALLLYGFVNYVIVKFTLRNFLVRFLEKFNPLVERPLPKPENPLKSTELDNLDELFTTLMQQLVDYISKTVERETQLQRLERYFSPALAEQLSLNADALEQTKETHVTVLFCDIRSFTHMSSQLAPPQVVEILNDYFTAMIGVLQGEGGTVLKLIGDAAMAVFGTPLPMADDALRAVHAAPKMHAAFNDLMVRWKERGLQLDIGMGIGINCGAVVVGNIGSPHHLDYTVIGDTVNVASRLAGVAGRGETIVSGAVAEALSGHISELEQREPVMVKGKDEPQRIFAVPA